MVLRGLKTITMQTRIFLVHMTASLGSKLFAHVKNSGMMNEGYAWITTQGLSSWLDTIDSKIMDSMQGVLGIRPYIQISKDLEDFERRWTTNYTSRKTNYNTLGLNLFGLRAYDTIWALAMAVEKANIQHSSFWKQNAGETKVDHAAIVVSEIGPRLLNKIASTRFQGLSGYFDLVKGQLKASTFEIFNEIGRMERIIGYWNPKKGLSREIDDISEIAYSISKNKLKAPIWPGDTINQPKKLRIGVPIRDAFNEFIKVEWSPCSDKDKPKISGFSIDVFLAVMDILPFPLPHEFVPYVNKSRQSAGTYDELLFQIKLKVIFLVYNTCLLYVQ